MKDVEQRVFEGLKSVTAQVTAITSGDSRTNKDLLSSLQRISDAFNVAYRECPKSGAFSGGPTTRRCVEAKERLELIAADVNRIFQGVRLSDICVLQTDPAKENFSCLAVKKPLFGDATCSGIHYNSEKILAADTFYVADTVSISAVISFIPTSTFPLAHMKELGRTADDFTSQLRNLLGPDIPDLGIRNMFQHWVGCDAYPAQVKILTIKRTDH